MASPNKTSNRVTEKENNKQTRTFGNLENEMPVQNGDAIQDESIDVMNDDTLEEHDKFSREMRKLGHADLKSPKAIKRKFRLLRCCKLLRLLYKSENFSHLSNQIYILQK